MSARLLEKLTAYGYLIRIEKPIGTLLLLWPTFWALWIASAGKPPIMHVFIFAVGTWLMRSAGCAINDYADRDFDKHVLRTKERPLTSGKISEKEALLVAASLAILAFALIWPLNQLTKILSVGALVVAVVYPFTKRFFAMPQAVLGIAFGFGIPMAFAAEQGVVSYLGWWMLVANVFWAIAYDTAYAMVDRDDDLKLGIKTSAITFGKYDVFCVMLCYSIFLAIMTYIALETQLNAWYYVGLAGAIVCALYHFTLIRTRERMPCFKAFLHNNWLGACLFVGIALSYATA